MNMKYLSIAEENITNCSVLVNLVSYRTRQLNSGARPMVEKDHPEMDNHDLALKEVAKGLVTVETAHPSQSSETPYPDFDASVPL